MIDQSTTRSLTASNSTRGTVALIIVIVAPLALAAAGIFYYSLASQASTAGRFALWGMFQLSVHDIDPYAEYQFLGLQLIAREYLYQAVFFGFFAVIASIGAANHWLARARDRRILAQLQKHGLA